MGVPAFYRWLLEKYPKCVQDVLEDRVHLNHGGIRVPFDWSAANPSGLECDNLYIDMNGIIHPCSHPENGPQPQSEEEMYQNVCRYVDRLMRAIRPRKKLFLAIDGVAPRAKMNQQRSRRFRSAQEAREQADLEESVRQEMLHLGQEVPPVKKPWDSNVITPGTPFMLRLSAFLRFYVRKRITEDKAWQNLCVIFSDASVPGEGEHKIMSHIRLQRSQPGYNPNLVHIIHGLDADLIMLALATHEMHFYVSRELVLFGRKSKDQHEQRQIETGFQDAQRRLNDAAGSEAMDLEENKGKLLQRVSLPILREYLQFEFQSCLIPGSLPFAPSFERLIDDIVFLCFFVGNDFLPHLPSLDIRDGALDFLFNVYKSLLPTMGDYITHHGGKVNLKLVGIILNQVAGIEDYVFRIKHENEERENRRKKEQRGQSKRGNKGPPPEQAPPQNTPVTGKAARLLSQDKDHVALQRGYKAKENARQRIQSSNSKEAEALKKSLSGPKLNAKKNADQETSAPALTGEELTNAFKEKVKAEKQKQLDKFAETVEDKVRLHESGWKDRYYTDKCKAEDVSAHGGREHLFRSYVVGLCWVMQYYYSGCPSWKWYYPFHYAPFASDLKNIECFQKDVDSLELSTPFNPVEQLMAVLPEDSSHAVPKPSRWLMSDPESPIIDFYPKDVPVDPNGKAMPWLWVVLLPFIDEERLLDAFYKTQEKWSAEDKLCNARGLDDGYVFLHKDHPMRKNVIQVYESTQSTKVRIRGFGFSGSIRLPLSNEAIPLDVNSCVSLPPTADILQRAHDNLFAEDIKGNDVVCVAFTEPPRLTHRSVVLPGARPPPPILKPEDKVIRRPKLNRGKDTIAHFGMTAGGSRFSASGSMNISNSERELAIMTGRGHQMYQAGTRAWGAAEPTPKRPRYSNHPGPPQATYHSNPFTHPQQPRQMARNAPPPWQQQQHHHQQRYNQRGMHPPVQQPVRPRQHPNVHPRHGHPQQHRPMAGNGGSFNFQSLNRSAPQHQRFNNTQSNSRANPDVIKNLRSQLQSTLKDHRNGGRQKR